MTQTMLTVRGRDPRREIHIAPAVLLAPMDGITDRVFRDLVIGLGGLGAACTEFVRLSVAPAPERVVRDYFGPPMPIPVGVQFMAAEPTHLAASIAVAERVGAAFIDLNFGCPAPVVFSKCAGSGLLAHPDRIAALVRTAVAATTLPVGAKLRVGITGPERLEEILTAIVAENPAFITLHARLRVHPYTHPATWAWLAQAKTIMLRIAPSIPLIGNGSVDTAEDVARMRAETGCDGVMIGRAALADPFIFRVAAGGPSATAFEAAAFAVRYMEVLQAAGGPRLVLGKIKQMLRWYRAGGLFDGSEDARLFLLRSDDVSAIQRWLLDRTDSTPASAASA
jgi:tRNA-dihydrouridine synthase C